MNQAEFESLALGDEVRMANGQTMNFVGRTLDIAVFQTLALVRRDQISGITIRTRYKSPDNNTPTSVIPTEWPKPCPFCHAEFDMTCQRMTHRSHCAIWAGRDTYFGRGWISVEAWNKREAKP